MPSPKVASKTARPLAQRIRRARLIRMEKLLRCIALPSPVCVAAKSHGAGQQQQPRADFQVRGIGSAGVDVESNLVPVEEEPDHAAVGKKIIGFAYGKNRLAT